MLTINRIKDDSSEKINIYNSMGANLLNFNIEYYQEDNILFPDYDLEYPYKFEARSAILNSNETPMSTTNQIMLYSYNSLILLDEYNHNYRGYEKTLKIKHKPKKVKRGELLLYFNNNKLYLLETNNIKPQLGVVVDEGDNDFIVSYIDTHYKRTVKTSKEDYKIIKEFNLNKIFNLTILIKVGFFNQIDTIYYTTDCIIKNEMLL